MAQLSAHVKRMSEQADQEQVYGMTKRKLFQSGYKGIRRKCLERNHKGNTET